MQVRHEQAIDGRDEWTWLTLLRPETTPLEVMIMKGTPYDFQDLGGFGETSYFRQKWKPTKRQLPGPSDHYLEDHPS